MLAVGSISAAIAIGIGGAVTRDLWLLAFVAIGGFIVCAYNLELLGGRFHGDLTFALAWGAFPLLTAYFASAGRLRWEALLAAGFAALSSYAQRRLSNPVRRLRREVTVVSGTIELKDGRREAITRETIDRGQRSGAAGAVRGARRARDRARRPARVVAGPAAARAGAGPDARFGLRARGRPREPPRAE